MFHPGSYPEKQLPKMLVISDLRSDWVQVLNRTQKRPTQDKGTRRRNPAKVKRIQAASSKMASVSLASMKHFKGLKKSQ